GGIVVDGGFGPASAVIDHNQIIGAGPTAVIAQNGIQISRGASAQITHNDVSGNSYTGTAPATGEGILLYQPGSVTVDHNTVSRNDVGIDVFGATNPVIDHNDSSHNTLFGIVLDTTTGAQVNHNTTNNN